MEINLYAASLIGHRKPYLEFVLKLLPSKKIYFSELFIKKSIVFFLMVENYFFLYFVTCLWRSLLGRETAGLLFRPKPVVDNPSFKLKIKRTALYILKRLPKVKTILIVPIDTHSEFSEICDGWIYDFQLWDLEEKDYQAFVDMKTGKQKDELFQAIDSSAGNRKVLCALGGQDRIKGFDTFAKTYINFEKIREKFLFAFGGKVKGFDDLAVSFENKGGYSENRFVSDEDLTTLYASSDLVWALYAEDYDQASGIFGRAVQYGIPVVVRDDSIIHQICMIENIPHIPLKTNETESLSAIQIPDVDLNLGREYRERFRDISINHLVDILGIKLGRNNHE